MVFFNIAFFGTGNFASIASFEISSVYRFITIFSVSEMEHLVYKTFSFIFLSFVYGVIWDFSFAAFSDGIVAYFQVINTIHTCHVSRTCVFSSSMILNEKPLYLSSPLWRIINKLGKYFHGWFHIGFKTQYWRPRELVLIWK